MLAVRIGTRPLSARARAGQPAGVACRVCPPGCMLGDDARGSVSFDPQRSWAPFSDVICIWSICTYTRAKIPLLKWSFKLHTLLSCENPPLEVISAENRNEELHVLECLPDSPLTLTVLGYFELHMTRGGGGGGSEAPSNLSPEGADRRETWNVPQKLRKENIFHKNCIFSYM